MRSKFILLLAIASAIAIVLGTWQLYRLTEAQQLWAYWPIPVLLGIWGLVVAFRQNTSRLHYLGLATIAGLGLGLGFPPLPTWPLQIFGFACLLYLTDALVRDNQPAKRQWWYAFHALLLYNIIATWWVANTAFAAGFVANYLNALLMTVPWVLIYLVRRYMSGIWVLAAVTVWVGFEYLHYNWQIAWPWLTLGNSLASTPNLAQWYEFTGVFGGSVYLATAGVLVYRIAEAKRLQLAKLMPYSITAAAWILVPLLISGLLYPSATDNMAGGRATVVAIQPNYEPHYAKFRVADRDQIMRLDSLLSTQPAADLYILPETAFGQVDQDRIVSDGPLTLMAKSATGTSQRSALVGVSSYRRFAQDNGKSTTRTQQSGNGTSLYYETHNAAVAIDEGQAFEIYNKSRLVPGVEFLPYRKALFAFEPLVKSLGGTTAGLAQNDSAEVFRYSSGIQAAPLICYESIYGDYVREFTQAGANLLTVPTNDGWWDNTAGHRQHLQFAQLRAIENRRWVVQSANSGVSAIINASGKVLSATKYNEIATLPGEVYLLQGQTLYVRYGDQLGRFCAGAAGLILLSLLAKMAKAKA